MKRQVWAGILCLCLLFGTSCAPRRVSAAELLTELQSELQELPEGKVYLCAAEEGSDGFFSPALREVMYGEGTEEIFSLIEDYAIYLSSFATPCEIAVFCLRSASDAAEVVAMCLARADALRVLLRETGASDMKDSIRIVSKGKIVLMGMTNAPDAWERRAHRLIR